MDLEPFGYGTTIMATILYIEDETDLRQNVVEELREAGFDTLEAADGQEGLEAIHSRKPNLVLCDISMPTMNGHELLQELRRSHPECAEIPFVFLTALGEKNQVIDGREMGADDYLVKPIDHDELIATVRSRLMQVSRMTDLKKHEVAGVKEEILQLLPHELRTPLNHIIGFSEIISQEMFGEIENKSYVEYGANIHRSGLLLLDMINNVLTLAAGLSGRLIPQPKPCNVSEIVTLGIDAIRQGPQSQRCSIVSNFSDVPIEAILDGDLLRQATTAVLDNAVKFSPEGADVSVNLEANNESILITISDTGIGMTPEQMKIALTPLSQVGKGLARGFEGLGNGLALAKCITEVMGGELSIESAPGAGTSVRLVVPTVMPN